MAISEITPFILSYNEEANIERCLESVAWASEILVLDSGSTDRTGKLVARYPQARFVTRAFDNHSSQANFGLSLIKSSWVLSLDSDYILTSEFQQALQRGEIPSDPANVYFAPFIFCVEGQPLRTSLMPPRGVLYTPQGALYDQDGHTQRLSLISRRPVLLPYALIHDDRKPLARWLDSQQKYAALEAEKLRVTPKENLALPDRLRRMGWVAPWIIFLYVLFVRGLVLDGWPGGLYAMQRAYAEFLLSLHVLEGKMRILSK